MSAPTVWEEGTWSGDRVTRFAVVLTVLLAGSELAVHQRLGPGFDIGFVVLCVFVAMAVRPRDFFKIGVLPPLLLLGVCLLLGIVWASSVARAGDGVAQAVISALAHRSGALFIGYALALLVLAIRHRVIGRSAARTDHSNLVASPAPYRLISGAPSEKSTTVVGDESTSPESRTASSS